MNTVFICKLFDDFFVGRELSFFLLCYGQAIKLLSVSNKSSKMHKKHGEYSKGTPRCAAYGGRWKHSMRRKKMIKSEQDNETGGNEGEGCSVKRRPLKKRENVRKKS